MSEITESEERLARPLIRLAKLVGVGTSYLGMSHDYHEIDDDVLIEVLAALGIDASSESAQLIAIRRILNERYARLVAPTVLHIAGSEDRVLVNTGILDVPSASITLENGEPYQGTIEVGPGDGSQAYDLDGTFISNAAVVIPADLPIGYHTLHVKVADRVQDATLISAPDRVDLLDPMKGGSLWGWMAQLYSIRSSNSWGVGDYEDLKTMLVDAKQKTGADFVLINPVHAAEPVSPLTPSPYLPVSRRLINFTYIRPEAIAEYATLSEGDKNAVDGLHADTEPLNGDSQLIDRDAMWRSKMHALWIIFKAGRTAERQSVFDQFKADCGSDLEAYATWCLCYDKWGAPNGEESNWERKFNRNSPEIANLRKQYPDTLDFYRWLEWIAAEQLSSAQQAAKDAGMHIGIMSDMAVGVHPSGADVWWNPERFAKGATVGAPPDMFNQQGQNWSQPPLSPINLETTGYEAYRNMVHGMFARAGAVRIDHILGLFRLWWIPQGLGARNGAYVTYNHEAMLGVLAIEATRAGGMVVGEDLGTVPDYVRRILADHGVLGTDVEWFNRVDDSPNAGDPYRAPKDYRKQALASVTTHDLPPTAGYLNFAHVKLREELHLLSEPVEAFAASAMAERTAMMNRLVENGYISQTVADDVEGHVQEIVEAMHAMLTDTPSLLLQAALVDGVGECRSQNQPGTSREYSNWRVPLADGEGHVVHTDEVFDLPRVQSLSAVMRREKR